ncbi:MAG: RagB/SusD family nutrient uptake outer membrane protein, partial [Prolixibacteraceae bacterium]|nr:RagB/SusD family nutrient uptake outer membrane protein [Prolixibacteraceae bacterium]
MKTLNNIMKLTGFCLVLYAMSTSCEDMMGDFLEKAPGVDVTVDTIFSTQVNAETFLTGIYREGMYTDLARWSELDGYRGDMFSSYCDESENAAAWVRSQTFYNIGAINDQVNGDEGRWDYRWKAIRRVNIFLSRVDDVPDASQAWKNQAKGQALFLRGLCYFEMFKRYGGVPLVDSIPDP